MNFSLSDEVSGFPLNDLTCICPYIVWISLFMLDIMEERKRNWGRRGKEKKTAPKNSRAGWLLLIQDYVKYFPHLQYHPKYSNNCTIPNTIVWLGSCIDTWKLDCKCCWGHYGYQILPVWRVSIIGCLVLSLQ